MARVSPTSPSNLLYVDDTRSTGTFRGKIGYRSGKLPIIEDGGTDTLKRYDRFPFDTMMLPTHALSGMVLALALALAAPEFAGIALVAGLLGGVVPDLDMYVSHRKTLHFPVYYSALAVVAVPVAVAVPAAVTVVAASFLLGAATHSVADVFGGGLELRPWEATSDRAVYDHRRGRWIAPRRWVRYDGAPEDLLLSAVLAVPLLIALDGVLRWIVVASLAVAAVYTAVRRVLPTIAELLVEEFLPQVLPDRILTHIPLRYLLDERPTAVDGDGR